MDLANNWRTAAAFNTINVQVKMYIHFSCYFFAGNYTLKCFMPQQKTLNDATAYLFLIYIYSTNNKMKVLLCS